MTDDECYDGLASGGKIEPDKIDAKNIFDDSYIIPKEFAQKWAQEVLDNINEDVIE